MVADGDSEGRARCVGAYREHTFFRASLTKEECLTTVDKYIPSGFVARRPADTATINDPSTEELAIPIAHFENGLRLPLWPEVRQVLKYYDVFPSQLTPNAIVVVVAFASYLRAEKIEFSMLVFCKVFSFRAYKDGTTHYASQHVTICETVNKTHYWHQKYVLVKVPFGNTPFVPLQRDEATYRPPASLGGDDARLYQYLDGKNFEVVYLRQRVDSPLPVPQGEGERDLPINPPHARSVALSSSSLAPAAAEAC